MKVLVMPSWYPNKIYKSGSFFKEQANFLNTNGYDVKVLMAEELHTKNYVFQRLKRLLKGQREALTTSFLDQAPEAYSFPLIIQKSWSEEKQINVANEVYLKAFKDLIKTGWIPDIIHVQGTFKAGFSAQYISKLYQIPYVVIEHSPFKLVAYSKFRREYIKNVLMQAKKVAGVSQYQKNRMLEDGIDRSIDVVWNFMDEDKFVLNTKASDSKFVITTITRPIKIKDVDTFFKAVSKFASGIGNRTDIEIVIVGHAAINDEIANTNYFEEQAKIHGISDICRCHAILSRSEIKTLLNRTQLYISTSLDEPYGVAVREAMLCGVPVISTKSGGPEDTVNTKTGILVDKKDSESIAKYIRDIYNGSLVFDSEYIRNYVISQSGKQAFLESMTNFYAAHD